MNQYFLPIEELTQLFSQYSTVSITISILHRDDVASVAASEDLDLNSNTNYQHYYDYHEREFNYSTTQIHSTSNSLLLDNHTNNFNPLNNIIIFNNETNNNNGSGNYINEQYIDINNVNFNNNNNFTNHNSCKPTNSMISIIS